MAAKPRNGQPLVYVDESSVKSLQALQATLASRADGKELNKALNKELSKIGQDIRNAQRANAKGLSFSRSGNTGTSRARRTQGVTASGRTRKGKGLRQELAASTRVQIRKGSGAGVRIIQNSTDPDVNKIGRRLNRRGKVRHPLFGNKEHWYDTTATNGTDWFWSPFADRQDAVRREIAAILDKWTRNLAQDINRKA